MPNVNANKFTRYATTSSKSISITRTRTAISKTADIYVILYLEGWKCSVDDRTYQIDILLLSVDDGLNKTNSKYIYTVLRTQSL